MSVSLGRAETASVDPVEWTAGRGQQVYLAFDLGIIDQWRGRDGA